MSLIHIADVDGKNQTPVSAAAPLPATIANGGGSGSVSIQGPYGSNATGSPGLPVAVAGVLDNASRAAGAAGRGGTISLDLAYRQVVTMGGVPQAHDFSRVSLSTTTETSLIAAVAANRHDLQAVTIANRDSAACTVDLRDSTGGTIRQSFIVPASDTRQFSWPAGLAAAALNTAWTVQLRAAPTTAVEISGSSYRTTA